MAGYGVSLHGFLGRGQPGSPQAEKDADPANIHQLLRQLRDQSVTQGDVATLRQEMLTLRMVVNTAKTDMAVLIEQEVGEAIARERAERAQAEQLLDERVTCYGPQLQRNREELERLQGSGKALRLQVSPSFRASGRLEIHARTVQESTLKLSNDARQDIQECSTAWNRQTQWLC